MLLLKPNLHAIATMAFLNCFEVGGSPGLVVKGGDL